MYKMRLLFCAGYWGLLTVLLLTADPAGVVGLDRGPALPGGDVSAHFLAFAVLALLVHGARGPHGATRTVLAVLILYGVVIESLQWFAPPRTVEVKDYANNLLGVAFGTGLYWLVGRLIGRRRGHRHHGPPKSPCRPDGAERVEGFRSRGVWPVSPGPRGGT